MLMLIDVGNSEANFVLLQTSPNIKTFGEWEIYCEFVIPTKILLEHNTPSIQEILSAKIVAHPIEQVLMVSVVQSIVEDLQSYIHYYQPQVPITVLTYELLSQLLDISIKHPHTLGVDRIIDVFSALQTYGKDLLVIDLGTATTFNILDDNGTFVGGAISIGYAKMANALLNSAEGLRQFDANMEYIGHYGNDTTSSINYGVYWGYRSMIYGIIQQIYQELQHIPKLILTGGNAHLFRQAPLKLEETVDEQLTLRGIFLAAQQLQLL